MLSRAPPEPANGLVGVVATRSYRGVVVTSFLTERGSRNRIVADLNASVVNDLIRVSAGSPERLIFVSDGSSRD